MEHLYFLSEVAPLGAAGLIAWLWLVERRAASERERELTEAHERLMGQKAELETLVTLVRDNTRAVSALEAGQRQLSRSLRATLRAAVAGRGTERGERVEWVRRGASGLD